MKSTISSLLLLGIMMTAACVNQKKAETYWSSFPYIINYTKAYNYTFKQLSGRVLSLNGEPIEGVLVEVFKKAHQYSSRKQGQSKWELSEHRISRVVTNNRGEFVFQRLPIGEYEIRLSKRGFETVSLVRVFVVRKPSEFCVGSMEVTLREES